MREIRVLERRGHKLVDDVEECLASFKRDGIEAHKASLNWGTESSESTKTRMKLLLFKNSRRKASK